MHAITWNINVPQYHVSFPPSRNLFLTDFPYTSGILGLIASGVTVNAWWVSFFNTNGEIFNWYWNPFSYRDFAECINKHHKGPVISLLVSPKVFTPAKYSMILTSWRTDFNRLFEWLLFGKVCILFLRKNSAAALSKRISNMLPWNGSSGKLLMLCCVKKSFVKALKSLNLPDFPSTPLAWAFFTILTSLNVPDSVVFLKEISDIGGLLSKKPFPLLLGSYCLLQQNAHGCANHKKLSRVLVGVWLSGLKASPFSSTFTYILNASAKSNTRGRSSTTFHWGLWFI